MAGIEQIRDEDIKNALIETNGQPTKAAEMLGVTYPHLYVRIRKNPELLEVQKMYRAKTFQNISNFALQVVLTGVIQEPELDKEGKIIEGSFVKSKVDYRTRISMIPNMMQTFKSDEGIKEEIIVENKNSFDYSKLSDETIRELLNAENSENNQ